MGQIRQTGMSVLLITYNLGRCARFSETRPPGVAEETPAIFRIQMVLGSDTGCAKGRGECTGRTALGTITVRIADRKPSPLPKREEAYWNGMVLL